MRNQQQNEIGFCEKLKISYLGREFTKDLINQASPVISLNSQAEAG
jgi:hypothetical protein